MHLKANLINFNLNYTSEVLSAVIAVYVLIVLSPHIHEPHGLIMNVLMNVCEQPGTL